MPGFEVCKSLGRREEDQLDFTWNGRFVTRIKVLHGWVVDGVQLSYGGLPGGGRTTGVHCGGHGGSETNITLARGEHIVSVRGQYAFMHDYYGYNENRSTVSRLCLLTSHGRVYGPFGTIEADEGEFEFSPGEGKVLVGVGADDDRYLNTLSCYFADTLGSLKDLCCRKIISIVQREENVDRLQELPPALIIYLKYFFK